MQLFLLKLIKPIVILILSFGFILFIIGQIHKFFRG